MGLICRCPKPRHFVVRGCITIPGHSSSLTLLLTPLSRHTPTLQAWASGRAGWGGGDRNVLLGGALPRPAGLDPAGHLMFNATLKNILRCCSYNYCNSFDDENRCHYDLCLYYDYSPGGDGGGGGAPRGNRNTWPDWWAGFDGRNLCIPHRFI
jgi:hypothetical protein